MSSKNANKIYGHYRKSDVDALYVAEQWQCSNARFSALKYIQRCGLKSESRPFDDMTKAAWYLLYEAALLSGKDHHSSRNTADTLIAILRADCSYPNVTVEVQD